MVEPAGIQALYGLAFLAALTFGYGFMSLFFEDTRDEMDYFDRFMYSMGIGAGFLTVTLIGEQFVYGAYRPSSTSFLTLLIGGLMITLDLIGPDITELDKN